MPSRFVFGDTVAKVVFKTFIEAYSSGTVADFHGIPF